MNDDFAELEPVPFEFSISSKDVSGLADLSFPEETLNQQEIVTTFHGQEVQFKARSILRLPTEKKGDTTIFKFRYMPPLREDSCSDS